MLVLGIVIHPESVRTLLTHRYGRAQNVSNRMRTSTKSASALFGVLRSAREGSDPEISKWVSELTSKNASASEIADEIISKVTLGWGVLTKCLVKNQWHKLWTT